MEVANFLSKFQLEKVRLGPKWASFEITFTEDDKNAAWELYVEMLTRITTQALPAQVGNEDTALNSIYSLFPTTREILRQRGRKTEKFSMIAIPVLNQVVRPFTTKWHRESQAGAFEDESRRAEFRQELAELQKELIKYNRMLADIAEVEDLTELEQMEEQQ